MKNFIKTLTGDALEKTNFLILLAFSFLIPLFFVPFSSLSLFSGKVFLIATIVFLGLILFFVASIRNKNIFLPKSSILLAGGAISLFYLVSAIFSSSMRSALIGNGLEIGTFAFVFLSFLLTFLFSVYFQSREKVRYFYYAFIYSFLIISVFQLFRLFDWTFLLPSIFAGKLSNPIGGWNELGIFFGLSALFSLFSIELAKKEDKLKKWLYGVLAIALIFSAIINFTTVWMALGVFSLFLLAYKFFKSDGENWIKKISKLSVLVFVLSTIFIIFGSNIRGPVSSLFNISFVEARLSMGITLDIAKNTLKESPYLGAGPNQFAKQWLMFKPESINNTIFWNTNFNSGFGFIPSSLVNVGAGGLILWTIFLGTILYSGIRLFLKQKKSANNHLPISVFAATCYLWLFCIVYTPGYTLTAMTFMFTGVFIALLVNEGLVKSKAVSFPEGLWMKVGRASLGIVLILVLIGGFFTFKNIVANAYYQRGLLAARSSSIEEANKNIIRAIKMDEGDIYYRSYSSLKILEFQGLSSSQNGSPEELQQQFQAIFNEAVNSSNKAIEIDQNNYSNWLSLAKVYESVTPLGVEGAYEMANSVYEKVTSLNPRSPQTALDLAKLEIASNNREKAYEYIALALNKKQNYKEAFLLLYQMKIDEESLSEAHEVMRAAASALPNDMAILLQLGILEYNSGNYQNAITVLERAVMLNPNYMDAKYFLGVSYYQLGEVKKAIEQLEDVERANPENEELKRILNDLREGREL